MSGFGTTVPERLNPSVVRQQQSQLALMQGLRVALPCRVESFDAAKQTVTVQPIITEVVRIASGLLTIPLDLLTDVPVVMMRAGSMVLTFPIAPGDECLVVFADVCIDAWYQSGSATTQQQLEKRSHELSDGIALFGPWSQPRKISAYSTSTAQLRSLDGTVVIEVAGNAVNITAPTVNVTASGTATVHGDTVNVTGSSQVNVSGNVHLDSKVFLTHQHTLPGGPNTGPVL